MYLNVFIYKMFNASAANISAMVAASAVAATLTTVFIGALSDKPGKRKIFICGFLPSTVKKNASLYLYLILFIVFNTSIQIFMPYLILYYEVSLGMTDYVFIMAPAIILASVLTVFWGRVYDKKGFSLSVWCSMIWLAAGYIMLFAFKSTLFVFIGSLLMMCGYLSGMAVFGAKIRDLTPIGKSGMLQGVRIFSQVLIPVFSALSRKTDAK